MPGHGSRSAAPAVWELKNIEFADFDEAVHAAFDGKELQALNEEANKLIQEYLSETH